MWERGLKCGIETTTKKINKVAPLVGAWIEIDREIYDLGFDESLPLWERGLKYVAVISSGGGTVSLPLWERGLKFIPIFRKRVLEKSLPLWERGLK